MTNAKTQHEQNVIKATSEENTLTLIHNKNNNSNSEGTI